jgi:hypothetical protein
MTAETTRLICKNAAAHPKSDHKNTSRSHKI